MYRLMVILVGIHAGNLWHLLPSLLGISTGFQLMMTEWMIDCLMDQQMNLMMYGLKGVFLGFGLSENSVQQCL